MVILMPEHTLSRRTFLAMAGLGASGVGMAALLGGCSTSAPVLTPLMSGPYTAGEVILGESTIPGMPQPFQLGGLPISSSQYAELPLSVKAAVYYPHVGGSEKTLHIAQSGPFPVLLYAHAFRGGLFANNGSHPADRDFTSVASMLQHVTTYGCVCVAPDLSWLMDDVWGTSVANTFLERAVVLVNYYEYLQSLNASVFKGQLDFTRVLVVGHSTGAGGAVQAGGILGGFGRHLNALAYGLIAPEFGGGTTANVHKLLVLGGTLDDQQDASPQAGYMAAGTPKTWVTIPGANHFGYTDICPADNFCDSAGLLDENGTITRDAQQQTAAAYLAALLRYYLQGDSTVRPYLTGQQQIPGLDGLGVSGIQVQQQGFLLLSVTPPPTFVNHP